MGGIGLYDLCIVSVLAPRLFKHAQPRGFSGLGLVTGIQIGWFNVAALGLLVGCPVWVGCVGTLGSVLRCRKGV